jgi:hypothetical protein
MDDLEALGDSLSVDLPTLETDIVTVTAFEDFIDERENETIANNTSGIWDL